LFTFRTEDEDGTAKVTAFYGWLAEPGVVCGRMVLTTAGERIGTLRVTFEEGLSWS
jgi:hypothetical protein